MIEATVDPFIVTAGLVAGASLVYGYFFGGHQEKVAQWFIDALGTPTRYKGVTNLAVGLALALPFAAVFAIQTNLLTGSIFMLGGLVSSIRASNAHDENDAVVEFMVE